MTSSCCRTSLGNTLESRPVEDVLFLRDEMANMAWAIERIVESAIERPRNRFDEEPRTRPARAPPRCRGSRAYRLAHDAARQLGATAAGADSRTASD